MLTRVGMESSAIFWGLIGKGGSHSTVSRGLQLVHLIARKQGVEHDCMFLSKLPIFSTGHKARPNTFFDRGQIVLEPPFYR